MESGQYETAVVAFDLALQFNPKLHRAQIGLVVALDLCGRDMTGHAPPKANANLLDVLQSLETLVRGLREGKRFPQVNIHAIRLQREMERRLAVNPEDVDALFLKSAFLAEHGRFEEAIECIDQLRQTNDAYPGAAEFRRHLKQSMTRSSERAGRARRRAGVPRS